MNPKQITAALFALALAAAGSSAALAQDKSQGSIAGKAAAAPAAKAAKAVKPAKATPPAATAAATATPAAVGRPAGSESALGHGSKEAGKSSCHHGAGSDA